MLGLTSMLQLDPPVFCCYPGTVGFIGPYKQDDEDGSGGLGVLVIGNDNLVYGDWHLSATEAVPGKRLRAGELLGWSGNSGFERHSGWLPHLDFEMRLLTNGIERFRIVEGRDYDDHLRYLSVPEGVYV